MSIRDLSGWPEDYKRRWRERNGFDRPKPVAPMPTLRLERNKPERAWINQPSKLQPLHHMHGQRVIAVRERDGDTIRIYLLEGPVASMDAFSNCLSAGWPPK